MITPIDPVGDIQTAMIARLKAAFTGSDGRMALKEVEPIEVPFDGTTEKEIRIVPPALYVTPLVISPMPTQGSMKIRWAVYAVASAATVAARTQGNPVAHGLGVYAIALRAALVLDEWVPPVDGASLLELGGIENLTGMVMRKNHTHAWALTFDGEICTALQNEVDGGINCDDLADFLIFHADIDLPPFADPPESLPAERDASLTVELPQ